MFCPNCGKKLEVEEGLFCPSCGAPLPPRHSEEAPQVQPGPAPAPQLKATRPEPAPAVTRAPQPPTKAPKKKSRTGLVIACVVTGLLVIGLAVLVVFVLPEQRRIQQYNAAVDLLDQNQFTAAAEGFRQLGQFADAEQLTRYALAREALAQGNYQQAADAFAELGDYMDSADHLALAQGELQYAKATEALQQERYAEALAVLEQIPDVHDARDLAQQCRSHLAYEEAQALFAADSYAEALARLEGVTGIPEAETLKQQCEDRIAYRGALEKYEAGAYEEAIVQLAGILHMPEAQALSRQCEDRLIYAKAREQYEAGAYAEAIAQLATIQDMPEADDLRKACQDRLIYASAMDLYTAGAYAEAAELFAQIPDVEDANALLQDCRAQTQNEKIKAALDQKNWASALALLNDSLGQNYPGRKDALTLCQNHIKYEEAEKALAEGKNYTAYQAFAALGKFEDAAAKAKACIVSKPSTGETYRNSRYSQKDCRQWIVTPSDGYYTYMKIYCQRGTSEELVSCIFIHPGKTAKITLPAGDYIFKVAYGKGNWYGPTEMFGDDGKYQRVGGRDYIMTRKKLSSSQYYELKLRVGSGGNMGAANENRDDF